MKKIFLSITLLILLSFQLQADPILRKGDELHLLASATIATTATALARHYGSSKFEAFWIGFGSSILVGVSKEYADSRSSSRTEDTKDIYADVIGASTGAIIATQFEWKF